MKTIKYEHYKEFIGVSCIHMKEDSPLLCHLTDKYCVGVNEKYDGSLKSFSQDGMERCPIYDLDFKRLFGKNLSDMIRGFRINENVRNQPVND
mgnify:FL=1